MPIRKVRRLADRLVANSHSRTARNHILQQKPGDYFVIPAPPYYSQFASSKLVSDILDKKIKAGDDPKWKSFGFSSKQHYEFWAWRLCGLICVKMILDAYGKAPNETVATLAGRGVVLGGYNKEQDTGWYHAPLVKLAKKYGLSGKTYRVLSPEIIAKLVIDNKFTVISVNPDVIRGDVDAVVDSEKGGHLVLVWGVKIEKGQIAGFFIQNPSGRIPSTQKKAFIPIKQFDAASGKRGLAIYK